MSAPTITLNQVPTDPTLKDLLDLQKKDLLLNLMCHHIGTIQGFNATDQTATASINYKKTRFKLNARSGQYEPVLEDYPLLASCPVMALGGADAALTFPIQVGDECLVLFNDRDIDNWFQGGPGMAVASSRLHSFSDGIILVGLRSLPNVIEDYDTVRTVLRNGSALVGVSLTQVKIANDDTTLNMLLQTLVTDLQTLITQIALITVTCAAPGNPSSPPINAAAIAAVSTSLGTLATQISGLLE